MSKTKKIILWATGIIVVLLILYLGSVLFFCPKFQDMAQNQEYRYCSQDSDCVPYNYDEGGCINKQNWLARYAATLCTACSFGGCLYPTSCTCENNQCKAHYDYGTEIQSEGEDGLVRVYRDGNLHKKNDAIHISVENNYDMPIYLVGYLQLLTFNDVYEWEETSCKLTYNEIIKINPGETKEFNFPTNDCSLDENRYEFKISVQYNFALEQSMALNAYSDLFFIKDNYVYSDDIGWDWDNEFPCHNLANVEECDQIDWPIIDSAHSCHFASKFMCYYCFAEMTKDPNICEKFSTIDTKEYCYVGVAAELAKAGRKNEINFCYKIREITQYNMRQECLNYTK